MLMLQHTKALYTPICGKLNPFHLPLLPLFIFNEEQRQQQAEVREREREPFFSSDRISVLTYNKQKEWQPCVFKSVPSCSTHELLLFFFA